ncbi:glycosyltransferase family 4 protein [Chitinophaga barathri]|uniref:Glycosyltransferase n=1 Tax=Chitinophaga barathri TaxID=1647451 RepID=A0A3N4MPB4_9BACT|nr:glycosyltransferase family 4 protein [Chitinophaga barathri]RPD41910.1 glycosyltransferase [Chitinophaga barathri]
MIYSLLLIKRSIEAVLLAPWIGLGRLIASWKPLREEYDIFLFFPFYHVGGAEKVHSEIAKLFPGKKVMIFFTKRSVNDAMLPAFEAPGNTIRDISVYTDNKFLYFNNLIWRGIMAAYISRQQKPPVVFNGQCNFAYKLSPHLPAHIRQIELIHSFCSFSYIRLPFIRFYEATVMISRESIQRHLELYRQYGVPAGYAERIRLIMNGIPLPKDTAPLEGTDMLLYVGRGTPEKRAHLVAAIAKEAGVTAGFIGNVEAAIPEALRAHCRFYGELTDAARIDEIYRRHRVIVITSIREGFPMVIMEGMARGLAVLATDAGDIPFHVREGENGFLLKHLDTEENIITAGAQLVKNWAPEKLEAMRENNIAYARSHFSMEAFAEAYRSLFFKA